ncbi:MAG TPA: hypothetical protein VGI60_10020 [Chthoniobacterales bacterium]|jgi:hypothetical protein
MSYKMIPMTVAAIFLGSAAFLSGQPATDDTAMAGCPMHVDHAKGVDQRGDKAMGFSHDKTTHHFRITQDGGTIEVTAKNANDQTSRDQIRGHLAHIAKLFAAGNFEIPMFVHDRKPPGVDVMQNKKDKVSYRYEEIEKGARVLITTSDPDALRAVHEFLRFQITDHRTGDPLQASKRSFSEG